MVRADVRYLILALLAAGPARAADLPKPAPAELKAEEADKKARELVRKLGDPVFRKREAAARELIELGGLGRAALEAARNDPDAEIRDRCRHLLPLALEADLRKKVADLGADTDGTREHDLPGWKRWKAVAGTGAASRAFYGEMVLENLDLMKNLDADPEAAAAVQLLRCQELYTAQFNRVVMVNGAIRQTNVPPVPPSIREFAALLFVSADGRVDKAAHSGGKVNYANQIGVLLYQPYVKAYLSTDKDAPIFKKLFVDWLDQLAVNGGQEPANGGPFAVNRINYALNAVAQNDLKEGLGFVEKVLAMKGLPLYSYSIAMISLGRLGEAKHAKAIEPFLTDDRRIYPNALNLGSGRPIVTELRDVALGITVHLAGQKPADFPFDGLKVRNGGVNGASYVFYHFGFEDDANRGKAFAQWNGVRTKAGLAPIPFEVKKDEEAKETPKKAAPVPVQPAPPVPIRPVGK